MIKTVQSPTNLTSLDDHRQGAGEPGAPATSQTAHQAPAAPAESDVRLLIEQSKATGVYVYTLIDRVSGRVLTSIPRETVQAMGGSPDYVAGAVASTKA